MMTLGWPWPIFREGQIWSLNAFIWGKLLKSNLMEEIYSKLPEWQKVYVYILTPKGLSAPALGLYTCIKTWKIIYKIGFKEIYLKLAIMSKVTRLFCWHQDFVHKGLSAPAPGLYTCGKNIKKCVYNQNSKRFVWNLQQLVEVIRAFCPCPRLYTCIKSLKVCIKSDFKEIILKLARYGQREKAFLLS